MTKLGINIDHVATVRQARKEGFPDPIELAKVAVQAGADGITAHLREDRRHIQDKDVARLIKELSVPFNLEMAADPTIVAIATKLKPAWACLVPEKREELTTEGGLNIIKKKKDVKQTIEALHKADVKVSLFIEPEPSIIEAAKEFGADAIEIHTGTYARAFRTRQNNEEPCSGNNLALRSSCEHELKKIVSAATLARKKGLIVNAGHGIDYENVHDLNCQFDFDEFNIGFAVVAHALKVGMETAVKEMKELMKKAVCAGS